MSKIEKLLYYLRASSRTKCAVCDVPVAVDELLPKICEDGAFQLRARWRCHGDTWYAVASVPDGPEGADLAARELAVPWVFVAPVDVSGLEPAGPGFRDGSSRYQLPAIPRGFSIHMISTDGRVCIGVDYKNKTIDLTERSP